MMNDGMFVVGFDPLELLNSDTKIKPDLLVKVSLSDKKKPSLIKGSDLKMEDLYLF